jgi:hypothetical protein
MESFCQLPIIPKANNSKHKQGKKAKLKIGVQMAPGAEFTTLLPLLNLRMEHCVLDTNAGKQLS